MEDVLDSASLDLSDPSLLWNVFAEYEKNILDNASNLISDRSLKMNLNNVCERLDIDPVIISNTIRNET